MNSLETSLKKAMKIEDLALEIAGHTHRHELEHLIISTNPRRQLIMFNLTPCELIDNKEDGIH